MDFISIASLGYFFLAVEAVASKFLITGKIKSWQVYLFYVGILSVFGFSFAFFGIQWYGFNIFLAAVFSGLVFFVSLAFLYRSLLTSVASRVYVLYGAVVTAATFIFRRIFYGEVFEYNDVYGILFLLAGGFFISYKFYKGRFFLNYKKTIIAGVLTAFSLVILKQVYDETNFVSGYVYSRVGMVVGALLLLTIPVYKKAVKSGLKKQGKKKNTSNFFATTAAKALAGLGAVIVSYAIKEGSVTIVNALISVQYLFTFLLATALAFYFKEAIKENLSGSNILYKLVGVLLVIFGVILFYV